MKKILFLLICISLFAQNDIEQLLESVKTHYYEGEYREAISLLDKATDELEKMENQKKIEAYMYLAFSYMAFGEEVNASIQFRNILRIDPNYTLDPDVVAPRIMTLFDKVKADFAKENVSTSSEPSFTPAKETKEIEKPSIKQSQVASSSSSVVHTDIIWRSALLPGLGQFYRGGKLAGYGFMGLWVSAIGFSAFAHMQYSSDKDAYESSSNSDLYDEYNSSFKRKNISYGIIGGVWAASLIEALIVKPELGDDFGFIYDPINNHVALTLSF